MVQDLADFKARHTGAAVGREGLGVEVARALDEAGILRLTKITRKAVVDAVFEAITEALLAGKRVEIRGFGTLKAHRRPMRRSYSAMLKKALRVDARWVVTFKTSPDVKRTLMRVLEA